MLQSDLVAGLLRRRGHQVELVTVVTEGDRRPVDMSPGVGVFVTALEQALLDGTVDLAVHSAKDVPLAMREELAIVAYPGPREDARDALITRLTGMTLETLEPGSTFGTDSPRRAGFLLNHRPDLRHVPMHGNVDTRLRRLGAGDVDALVLAAAGLDRLGSSGHIDERIEPELLPPAPGQGALAVQCRADDDRVRSLLGELDDPAVRLSVVTERRVLEATGGTCRAPVGALAAVAGGRLWLLAGAAAPDGSARCVIVQDADPTEAAGQRLAEQAGRELMNKVVTHVA
jgi:hydroxymethylbilane synthase